MSLANFQERLKNARNEQGMTQKNLASKLGVTEQAVSKWERGSSYPDVAMLDQIANVLDCSLDYLFQFEKGRKSLMTQEDREGRDFLNGLILPDIFTVRFGEGLVDAFLQEMKDGYVRVHEMRKRAALEWGIFVPEIRLMDEVSLSEREYRILIHGISVYEEKELAEEDAVCAVERIMDQVQRCAGQYFSRILNDQGVYEMVELVRQRYPVVAEPVPEKISYSLLRRVLVELFEKRRYPLHQMILILQTLEDHMADGRNVSELADCVAAAMEENGVRQWICNW